MCGIAGILSIKANSPNPEWIRLMTDAMQHRGPDAGAHFEQASIALGHRRLSIIDTSDAANQPFTDASGRYTMVFNGELYNYRDVRRGLQQQKFKTEGDTEVLIEAFAEKGFDAIHEFKGMYAFAVWDAISKELTVARDRMGVKPLYYYQDEDWFIFASEIRAILATGLVPRKIDTEGLYEYLMYQSVAAPHTLVCNIRQLEAGHVLRIREGKVEDNKYWSLLDVPTTYDFSSRENVKQAIRNRMRTAVEGRMISDVPIGAFLSGGIDSSAVVALMSELSSTAPDTFSVAFSESEFDESVYAATVAKKFNTHHHKILLQPEAMLEALPTALQSMDVPSGDGINTFVVSDAVKKAGITVALSGIGGDELFAGYPFFKTFRNLRKTSPLWALSKPFRAMALPVLHKFTLQSNRKIRSLLQLSDTSLASTYPLFRKIWMDDEISNITRLGEGTYKTRMERFLRRNQRSLAQFPIYSQISIAEFMGYTQQTLLKDTDQMGMAVSLEIREPFFDHDLVSYVLQIPDAMKHPRFPKQLLVESMGDLLPSDIVHRKKQGFTFPWDHWLRNELRSFCEEKITHMAQRSFIQGDALKTHWQQFLNGDPSIRWIEIWLFVVLENWLTTHQLEA